MTSHAHRPGLLRRGLDALYALGGALAALCVLAIFILMVWASIGRELDWRVSWVNDVVSWLCAASAFLGMAYSFRNGDFVRVTLLLEKVPAKARQTLEVLCLLVALLAIGYLAYWAALYLGELRVSGHRGQYGAHSHLDSAGEFCHRGDALCDCRGR